MPVDTSAFSASQPSNDSLATYGDDQMRSDKSVLEATLNEEHYFAPQDSASSASGGVHRHGSARAYYDTNSRVSSASDDDTGRLFFATDTGSLHALHSSSASTLVGGNLPTGVMMHLSASSYTVGAAGSRITLGASDPDALPYEVPSGAFAGGLTWGPPSGLTGLYRIDVEVVTEDVGTETHLAYIMDASEVTVYARGQALNGSYPSGFRRINFSTVLECGGSNPSSYALIAAAESSVCTVVGHGGLTQDLGTRVSMFKL